MSNGLIIDDDEEERKNKHLRHSFVFHSTLVIIPPLMRNYPYPSFPPSLFLDIPELYF